MKKYMIYLTVCSMILSCSCVQIEEPNISCETHAVTVRFDCQRSHETRSTVDENRIEDVNLYLIPLNDGTERHIYIAPVRDAMLELPKGEYDLFAVANLGYDTGKLKRDEILALCCELDPRRITEQAMPMSAQQVIEILEDTQINLSLVRAVAKVNFQYTVDPSFAKELTVHSVQLRKAARSVLLFGSSSVQKAEDITNLEAQTPTGDSFTSTYYLLENRQGTRWNVSGDGPKMILEAPEYATYLEISGSANGKEVSYRIFIGDDQDFNLTRNKVYNINARILGMNTIDWHVSTIQLHYIPFAEKYSPGRTAKAYITLSSESTLKNEYFLSYQLEAGNGTVTIDGKPCPANTPFAFHSGSGTKYGEIAYTQSRQGEVRLRIILTDRYGWKADLVLETSFIKPSLKVSFSQQGDTLTLQDRASMNFTVDEDGNSGPYSVTVAGTPSLFKDADETTPATEFSVPQNGTYSLRIRPEAEGENPYKITVQDINGQSVEFNSSVTGVAMYSRFTLNFSKTTPGYLNLTVSCSYPPMESVVLIVRPTINALLSGGKTTTRTYTMNVMIPAGKTSGKGTAVLNLGNYFDYTVGEASVVFSPSSSRNGLLQYTIQPK